MASVTVTIPSSVWNVTSRYVESGILNPYISIDSDLSPGDYELWLFNVSVPRAPGSTMGLRFADVPAGQPFEAGNDLSDLWETQGSVLLTASDGQGVNVRAGDDSEPYIWTPSNIAEVNDFANHLAGLTDRTVTLTLTDNARPPLSTDTKVDDNEIILDGQAYPILGTVSRVLASVYPGKVTIGDSTRDSRPRTSVLSWTDFTGGIGIERLEGGSNADRLWFSTFDSSHKGHLVLPPRADPIPMPAGVENIVGWGTLSGALFGVFQDESVFRVYRYDGGSWGAPLHTLRGDFNTIDHVEIDGDDHLVVGHTLGVAYSSNGQDWSETGAVV